MHRDASGLIANRTDPPFVSVVNSNDVVLMHHRIRREAQFRAMTAMQPSMAPLFHVAVRNPEGPEHETDDPTPRGARALSAASSSGDIKIEIPPARLSIGDLAPIVQMTSRSS